MLEELKELVCRANIQLSEHGLVTLTWGNVSQVDRAQGLVVIKPSGVEYRRMGPEDMCVVSLDSGVVVEGKWSPSSDLLTHLELYRSFPEIGAVVHTHSRWATIFAQCGIEIPSLGTTHGDYFYGTIPCTRPMRPNEVEGPPGHYEQQTGKVIVETFAGKDPMQIPSVLVHCHGPFCWGRNAVEAVSHAVVLEELAFMAWHQLIMCPEQQTMSQVLLDRHYLRKHGAGAYYGQKN